MKKIVTLALSSALIFGIAPGSSTAATTFKNCTELNKQYTGGIAKDSKVRNKGGKTKFTPFVSAALYNANSKLDRDKDGIACER